MWSLIFSPIMIVEMLVLAQGTDGMIEATADDSDESEEFGVDRLIDIAREMKGKTAKEVAEAMMHAVDRYRGEGEVQDDRTVVVITYPPTPGGV